MKVTHKEYLENTLYSKKMELRELEIQHRIAIAEYNAKRNLMQNQIDSIERQLKENAE